jgi:hypothetical protein
MKVGKRYRLWDRKREDCGLFCSKDCAEIEAWGPRFRIGKVISKETARRPPPWKPSWFEVMKVGEHLEADYCVTYKFTTYVLSGYRKGKTRKGLAAHMRRVLQEQRSRLSKEQGALTLKWEKLYKMEQELEAWINDE